GPAPAGARPHGQQQPDTGQVGQGRHEVRPGGLAGPGNDPTAQGGADHGGDLPAAAVPGDGVVQGLLGDDLGHQGPAGRGAERLADARQEQAEVDQGDGPVAEGQGRQPQGGAGQQAQGGQQLALAAVAVGDVPGRQGQQQD